MVKSHNSPRTIKLTQPLLSSLAQEGMVSTFRRRQKVPTESFLQPAHKQPYHFPAEATVQCHPCPYLPLPHIEDCGHWWLFGCDSTVIEYWWLKPGVYSSILVTDAIKTSLPSLLIHNTLNIFLLQLFDYAN